MCGQREHGGLCGHPPRQQPAVNTPSPWETCRQCRVRYMAAVLQNLCRFPQGDSPALDHFLYFFFFSDFYSFDFFFFPQENPINLSLPSPDIALVGEICGFWCSVSPSFLLSCQLPHEITECLSLSGPFPDCSVYVDELARFCLPCRFHLFVRPAQLPFLGALF